MALNSMTGFGAGGAEVSGVRIDVEITAVNHRFLDISWRMPTLYGRYEGEFAKIVREQVRRGHFDVTITRRAAQGGAAAVVLNENAFSAFLEVYRHANELVFGKGAALRPEVVGEILRRGEVLESRSPEENVEVEAAAVVAALKEALSHLVQTRAAEGAALEADLLQRLGTVERMVGRVEPLVPAATEAYRERLHARLQQILSAGGAPDEQRLAQEVALFADRSDVSEELTRLGSHCEQFRRAITKNEGGKKFEFLLQEMGREVNTIGSKAQSAEITAIVVDTKAELEKLREQIQNVE